MAESSLYSMFTECSSLCYIEVYADSWSTLDADDWVYAVNPTGVFASKGSAVIPNGDSGVPLGWRPSSEVLMFTTTKSGSTISLSTPSSLDISLSVSTDGSTWATWNKDSNGLFSTITLYKGDTLFVRATSTNQTFGTSTSVYSNFRMTGGICSFGNIMYLLDCNANINSLSTKYYCFYCLFIDCASLITAPELPAMKLGQFGYCLMFCRCTNLTTPPELPAIGLGQYCYYQMFFDCISLTTAPELPATTLAANCYDSMFYGCTSIKTTPNLPATTLPNYCYQNMFHNCTSLTAGADMQSATTIAQDCCKNMYNGCSNLSSAWTPNISSWNTSYFNNWLSGVAATGTLYKPNTLSDIPTDNASGIPTGWSTALSMRTVTFSAIRNGTLPFSYTPEGGSTVQVQSGQSSTATLTMPQSVTVSVSGSRVVLVDGKAVGFGSSVVIPYNSLHNCCTVTCVEYYASNALKFTANTAGSTVGMAHSGTNATTTPPVLYKSTDSGSTWSSWDGTSVTLPSVGSSMLVIGLNPNGISSSTSNYSQFTMSGSVAASGDTTSLLGAVGSVNAVTSYCFYKLFQGCTSLTTPPELPSTMLAQRCYTNMFTSCSALTIAPELPATTLVLYCYSYMFQNCTNLTIAPELNAIILAEGCYYNMFRAARPTACPSGTTLARP